MLFFAITFGALLGCGGSAEQPQSVPVASSNKAAGGTVEMAVDLEGPKPIATAELQRLFPQLAAVTTAQLQIVSGVANLVPSPCEACGDLPLAHCAEQGHIDSCGALNKLINRAVTLTVAGRTPGQVKAAVNYPDLWFDGMGAGAPVQVTIYQDTKGGFTEETSAAISALRDQFGDQASITLHDSSVTAPAKLGVRSRPTFFVNGHRFRGAQTPKTLSRFVAFELMDVAP